MATRAGRFTTQGAGFAAPRFKVRFPDHDSLLASQSVESVLVDVRVQNDRRRFISVEAPPVVMGIMPGAESHLERHLEMYRTEFGAEVVEDFQYTLEELGEPAPLLFPVEPEDPAGESLDDVLKMIRASAAWETSRGEGVVIAVVDTGVNGDRPEFPAVKRKGQWAPPGADPWEDYLGHGTMCACIAAATKSEGGEFDGVAPDAGLISCRTQFYDSELATLYDYLTDFAGASEEPLVVTNSFGTRVGTPPALPARQRLP